MNDSQVNYGHFEERIRKVLQNIGIRPKVLSGIDIDAEFKMVFGANVCMDAARGRKWAEIKHDRRVNMARKIKETEEQAKKTKNKLFC